jgi:hypothetical protein
MSMDLSSEASALFELLGLSRVSHSLLDIFCEDGGWGFHYMQSVNEWLIRKHVLKRTGLVRAF